MGTTDDDKQVTDLFETAVADEAKTAIDDVETTATAPSDTHEVSVAVRLSSETTLSVDESRVKTEGREEYLLADIALDSGTDKKRKFEEVKDDLTAGHEAKKAKAEASLMSSSHALSLSEISPGMSEIVHHGIAKSLDCFNVAAPGADVVEFADQSTKAAIDTVVNGNHVTNKPALFAYEAPPNNIANLSAEDHFEKAGSLNHDIESVTGMLSKNAEVVLDKSLGTVAGILPFTYTDNTADATFDIRPNVQTETTVGFESEKFEEPQHRNEAHAEATQQVDISSTASVKIESEYEAVYVPPDTLAEGGQHSFPSENATGLAMEDVSALEQGVTPTVGSMVENSSVILTSTVEPKTEELLDSSSVAALSHASFVNTGGDVKEGELAPILPSKEGTSFFNDNDVLSGRGGGTNVHPGNRNFRDLINMHRRAYLKARKNDKPAISRAIVRTIRESKGRFLKKDEKSGLWFEVGDDAAREKTSQALRQRAPEMRKLLFDTEREEARVAAQDHNIRQQRMLIGMPQDMMNGSMPSATNTSNVPPPTSMALHPAANPMYSNQTLFGVAGKNGMPSTSPNVAQGQNQSGPSSVPPPPDPYMAQIFNAAMLGGAGGFFPQPTAAGVGPTTAAPPSMNPTLSGLATPLQVNTSPGPALHTATSTNVPNAMAPSVTPGEHAQPPTTPPGQYTRDHDENNTASI